MPWRHRVNAAFPLPAELSPTGHTPVFPPATTPAITTARTTTARTTTAQIATAPTTEAQITSASISTAQPRSVPIGQGRPEQPVPPGGVGDPLRRQEMTRHDSSRSHPV
jgi:hypothetical protein